MISAATGIAATGIAASGIATSVSTGITTVRWLVGILDIAAITAGHALENLTILVQTGNLDGCILQLVLYVGAGGENDTTGGDQTSLHILQVLHGLTAHAESHGSQSGQGHRVTLGGLL